MGCNNNSMHKNDVALPLEWSLHETKIIIATLYWQHRNPSGSLLTRIRWVAKSSSISAIYFLTRPLILTNVVLVD